MSNRIRRLGALAAHYYNIIIDEWGGLEDLDAGTKRQIVIDAYKVGYRKALTDLKEGKCLIDP